MAQYLFIHIFHLSDGGKSPQNIVFQIRRFHSLRTVINSHSIFRVIFRTE